MLPADLIEALRSRRGDAVRFVDHQLSAARPAAHAPVSTAELVVVEQRLGFNLPEPLQELYLQVANGGLDRAKGHHFDGWGTPSLRRILIDMIEEYARHTGHADLIREAIDGRVGEDAPA